MADAQNNASEIGSTGDPGVWKAGEGAENGVSKDKINVSGDTDNDKKELENPKEKLWEKNSDQPWWTPECDAVQARRVAAAKAHRENPSLESNALKKKIEIDCRLITAAAKQDFISKLEKECGEPSTTEGQGHGDSGQVWTPSKAYIDYTQQELMKLKKTLEHWKIRGNAVTALTRCLTRAALKCKYNTETVASSTESGETVKATLHLNYILMAKGSHNNGSDDHKMHKKLQMQLYQKAIYILRAESIENIMSGQISVDCATEDLDEMSGIMEHEFKEKLTLLKMTVMAKMNKLLHGQERNFDKVFRESKCGLQHTTKSGRMIAEDGKFFGFSKKLLIERKVFVSVKMGNKKSAHRELHRLFIKTIIEKTVDELYEMHITDAPVCLEWSKLEGNDSDTTNKGNGNPKLSGFDKDLKLEHQDVDPGFFGDNMEVKDLSAMKRKMTTTQVEQSSQNYKRFCPSNSEFPVMDEFDSFGQTVAHSLRSMSTYHFNYAKKCIVDVLYDIQMNDLSGTVPTQASSQSQQSDRIADIRAKVKKRKANNRNKKKARAIAAANSSNSLTTCNTDPQDAVDTDPSPGDFVLNE